MKNKRYRYLNINGEIKNIKEWFNDDRCEVSYETLLQRSKNSHKFEGDSILKYKYAITDQQILELKETLYQLHINENKNANEIAKILNLDWKYIRKWLTKFELFNRATTTYKDPEIGTEFNRWTFLSVEYNNNIKYWKCRCVCGNEKLVVPCSVGSGNSKSCGCYNIEKIKARSWKGHGEISGHYWWVLQNSAKTRNIEFLVTIEFLWDLFLKQNRKCALSGKDIYFDTRTKYKKSNQTASLDRINNNRGYFEDNVQWVHKYINNMKLDHSQEDFIKLCEEVAKWNQKIV